MFARLLLCFLLCAASSFAQNGFEGTEFFFAFPPNGPVHTDPKLSLDISSNVNAKGVACFARGKRGEWRTNFSVRAGMSEHIVLPKECELASGDGGFANSRVLSIETDNPVTVRAMNRDYHSSEATTLIPTSRWGKEYFVASYTDDWLAGAVHPNAGGEAVIIATFDDTRITITPHSELAANLEHDVATHAAGKTFSVTLDHGQALFLESSARQGLLQDITGTHITSTKPIGLVSGHRMAAVPTGVNQYCLSCEGRNHLLEMIPSVESWGKKILTAPFATRTRGDAIRILARRDNTHVARNGAEITTLSAGGWIDVEGVQDVALWTANEPICVFQYSYSRDVDAQVSDPFYLFVPPIDGATPGELILREPDFAKRFVNVLAENPVEGVITLDNIPLEESEGVKVQREGKFFFATIDLKKGIHTLSSIVPFVAISYGFDTLDGYGNAVYAGLREPGGVPDTISPVIHVERSLCGEFARILITDNGEHDNGIARIEIVPENSAAGKNLLIDRDRSSNERKILLVAHSKDSSQAARGLIIARDIAGNIDSVLIKISSVKVLDVRQLPTLPYDSGSMAQVKVEVMNRTRDTLVVPSFTLRSHSSFALLSQDAYTFPPGERDTLLLGCDVRSDDRYTDTLDVSGACIALRNSVLKVERAYPKLSVRWPLQSRLQLVYGDTADQGAPVVLENTGTDSTIVYAVYSNDQRLEVESFPAPPFVLSPGECASAFVHVASSKLIGKASLVVESNAKGASISLPIESVPPASRKKLPTLDAHLQKRFTVDNPIVDSASSVALTRYLIPIAGKVRYQLRSSKGKIMISEEQTFREGAHQWAFDTSRFEEGSYYYSIKYAGSERSGKIVK